MYKHHNMKSYFYSNSILRFLNLKKKKTQPNYSKRHMTTCIYNLRMLIEDINFFLCQNVNNKGQHLANHPALSRKHWN